MSRMFACGVALATLALSALTPSGAGAEEVAPVVPGYVRLKTEAKAQPAELGQVLLGELNCLECHAAPNQQRVLTKGGPDLSSAGARLTPQYVRAYLLDTHGIKPGTTMPDLFHASEAQAKAGAVEYLTHYLMSQGGPMKAASTEGTAQEAEQGRALFQHVGCAACHAPTSDLKTAVPSVPLPTNLAEKTTVEALSAFLMNPAAVRPGGRMPNLNLTAEEAVELSVYLLRDQLNNPQNKTVDLAHLAGVKYTWYLVNKPFTAALEKVTPLKPKGTGRVANFSLEFPRGNRQNNFIVKFDANLHIEKAGKYTFYTHSDDGSRLYIDGQLVVDNDGVHPPTDKAGAVQLTAGDHPIIVTYFQEGGGYEFKTEWEGPGVSRQEIPRDVLYTVGGTPMVPLKTENFVVDPEKARMGGMMFSAIGCVSCHAVPGAAPAMKPHKALAELNVDSPTGCLGDQIPKSVPNYHLSDEQKTALKAAVKDAAGLAQPLSPGEQVVHLAAAFNCYACHVRNEVGGPTADRTPFFVMTADFDMGDEGRYPPRLTNVGAKLTPEALTQIIFENKLHIRPVLATRMPSFSKEKAGPIVEALAKADAGQTPAIPAFDAKLAKDGRTLFGTRGMGCVNCHGVNGVKSLGMPAPDLGTAHERLQFSWFRALLVDPAHVNPGTRMPAFWANGDVAFKNLAGGSMDSQIAAIWDYLSLGESMALPAGLSAGGDELVPSDGPIVHRTFFTGAGNRAIAVGFPEMVHVVFDADVVRMAKAWKGRFFDAKGMWEGRGGNHLGPLGTDVINLPPGPSFAVLESPQAPWPLPKPSKVRYEESRNLGGKFKGYVLDKEERPTFRYILNDVEINEQPLPVQKASGSDLRRKFELTGKQAAAGLNFLAAQGKTIESKSPGEWLVDGKLSIKLLGGSAGVGAPVVRDSAGDKQLLLPVSLTSGSASFTVEMSW